MTRLRHYDNLGTARFVTFSCYRRYRLFHGSELIGLFLEEVGQKPRASAILVGHTPAAE